MTISAATLTYLSLFFWVLPPLRQYKTSLFIYFLILAISDLFGLLLFHFLKLDFSYFYIIVSFSSLIALQKNEYLRKKWILFSGSGLIVISLSFIKFGIGIHIFFLTLLHLMIIFRILYLFVMVVAQKQSISFFYLVLAFYEFTVLLKFFNYLFPLNVDAHTYFYITTIFELLVGVFFTLFREDSPKLVYQLK